MKKTIIYFFIAILIGFILSKYIFNEYEGAVLATNKEKTIYIFQYQAYKDKDVMIENAKALENYFYYKENNIYHVIIGISSDEKNIDKIKKAYNISGDIYIKQKKIKNQEFLINLKEYDKLIAQTDDSTTIINAEKQIMAKFEELILNE